MDSLNINDLSKRLADLNKSVLEIREGRIDKLTERVDKLTETAQKIKNFAYVISTVALFFGIGGTIGYKILSTANSEIKLLSDHVKKLNDSLEITNKKIKHFDIAISEFINRSKIEIDEYTEQKKEFIVNQIVNSSQSNFNASIKAVHRRINSIKLEFTNPTFVDFLTHNNTKYTPQDQSFFINGIELAIPGHNAPIYHFKSIRLHNPSHD